MNQPKTKADTLRNLWILIAVITLIWLGVMFLDNKIFPDLGDRGLFGDSFGMINSLFSGLAFAGIIYTIFLQRKELALQREELAQTREELKRSADAQIQSQDALRRQVANMRQSTRLDALNTLVTHYSRLADLAREDYNFDEKQEANKMVHGYVKKIQEILDIKDELQN